MPDIYERLLPFAWRDIQVPTGSHKLRLRHDLVQHKRPGQNGAPIEDMGTAPLELSAKIPFLTQGAGSPGKTENFGTAPLYPDVWRAFFAACQKGATGILQHPELGRLKCKVESFECSWEPEPRDGVQAEVSWLETLVDGDNTLAQPSPLASAQSAAVALDLALAFPIPSMPTAPASVPQIPNFPKVPVYQTTFSDLMRSIQAIGDQSSALIRRAANPLDTIAYRCQAIIASLNRIDSALNWAVKRNAQILLSAVTDLRMVLLISKREIGLYPVPATATLASIAQAIPGALLGEVMALNSGLLSAPVVPKATIVRYYLPKAA